MNPILKRSQVDTEADPSSKRQRIIHPIVQKYHDIFENYIGSEFCTLLKNTGRISPLTFDALVNVVKEADKYFDQLDINGRIIEVDGKQYGISAEKLQKDEKETRAKRHIIALDVKNWLANGSSSTIYKVLLVSEGRFVPYKVVNVENKGIPLSFDQISIYRNFINNEFNMLNEINGKEQFQYFQHKPITFLDCVSDSSPIPIIGLVGNVIYSKNLFSKIEWMINEKSNMTAKTGILNQEIKEIESKKDDANAKIMKEFKLTLINNAMKGILIINSQQITFCKQLVRSVCELHQRGFVHRDIKPENVFMDQDNAAQEFIRIGDFEGSKKIEQIYFHDFPKQSDKYLSPSDLEYIRLESNAEILRKLYLAQDVFATGISLYFILTGKNPYQLSPESFIPSNSEPNLKYLESQGFSKEIANVIGKMIELDFKKRISIEEAQKIWMSIPF